MITKQRQGSRIVKQYDEAQTPYQRVLATETIPTATKNRLKAQFAELDPLALQDEIAALQDALWQHANRGSLQGTTQDTQPDVTKATTVEPTSTSQPQDTSMPISSTDTVPLAVHPFTEQDDQLDEKVTQRYYRHSPRQRNNYSGPRYWRTRKDPFLDVWDEVQMTLEQQPHLVAKTLFLELQKKYPGRFSDGQLRTFQRRVSDWRLEFAGRRRD